jgi:SsrA-binding protein
VSKPLPSPFDKAKVVAENRRARFDYFVEERLETGIALTGTEVKSLRFGEGSIAESYAAVEGEEVWLINSHIPEYSHGNRLNHHPRRPRKLLLKGREIAKLHGAVTRQGLTLVPLSIYFNGRGRAKVELAIARGKKMHDKRETQKERDWKREQQRLLRHNG